MHSAILLSLLRSSSFGPPGLRLDSPYRATEDKQCQGDRPPPTVPVLIDISSAAGPIVSSVSIIDTFVLRRYGPNVIFAADNGTCPPNPVAGHLICRVITKREICIMYIYIYAAEINRPAHDCSQLLTCNERRMWGVFSCSDGNPGYVEKGRTL